jgi:protease-4
MIRRIFRFLGRSIDFVRLVLGRILFLLLLVLILGLLFSSPATVQVPVNSVVIIDPAGAIVEQQGKLDPAALLIGSAEVGATALRDVVDTLDRASNDSRVRAVLLDLTELSSISPAAMETIGAALERYKDSGKALLAHGDYFSQAQYFLASYADTVYLHPMGQLLLPGYGGSQIYFAELLENLGVDVHIFRVGTHKAAVEPFSMNSMSEESRGNSQQLVDELWQHYISQVAANRSLSEQALLSYANEFPQHLLAAGGDTALVALQHGLVDELVSQLQFRERLAALVGEPGSNPRSIRFQQYLSSTAGPELPGSNQVGVIVAQGSINMGEQPRGMIGAESLMALIRDARRDESIKALVLRVDSPGGSALASELIRQELEGLQNVGKPLVVSMGGTAASGGYWISAMADEIWASPVTVTGSIGIFGLIPTFETALARLGVYTDGVSTTPLGRADVLSDMSDAMATVFQASVEDGYARFLRLVADGRNMSVDEVDLVAQGQIWSGAQAQAHGLVDHLGDLDNAIAAAARLAGLDDYQTHYIEESLSPGERLLQELIRNFGLSALIQDMARTATTPLPRLPRVNNTTAELARRAADLAALVRFDDPRNLYSVCEFCTQLR